MKKNSLKNELFKISKYLLIDKNQKKYEKQSNLNSTLDK